MSAVIRRWPFRTKRVKWWPNRLDGRRIVAPCGRCGYGWPDDPSHTRLNCAQMQLHHLTTSEVKVALKAVEQCPALLGIGAEIVRLRDGADRLEEIFIRKVAEAQGWEAP